MKAIKKQLSIIFIIAITSVSFSQKSTEMFIPIGKSPGLSGIHTLEGDVESLNNEDSSCTLRTADGSKTVTLMGNPMIYLDYSKHKTRNKYGKLTDINVGSRVEMKYLDNEKRDSIEWVKIEMKSPN